MSRGLWLLIGLRVKGWARRLARGANTVRGALLLVVGALVFAGWVTPLFLEAGGGPTRDPEEVRRWGPLLLLGFWLLNVAFSSNEGAVTFTPAEINLLFPAPLSRRQLLAYKIALFFFSSVVSALFMALFFRRFAASYLAAVVALALGLFFLQSFTVFLSLLASAVGARAYDVRRRILLALILVALLAVVVRAAVTEAPTDWHEWVDVIDRSWFARVLLAPLRWFVLLLTADQLWPDALLYAALALLVNGVCLAAIFLTDAQYLEASAAASERLYARMQRVRRGGPLAVGTPGSGGSRWRVPAFPSWGGVGTVWWRQAATALRSWWSMVIVLLLTGVMAAPVWFEASEPDQAAPVWLSLLAMMVGMTLFVPALVPFDFRGDLDRMDMLKALPLPAWRLVVGQLLTPVILVSLAQLVILGAAQLARGRADPTLLAALAFAWPFNALMFGLENWLFLLFPSRILGAAPGDIQALGRQVVLWVLKMLVLLTLGGVAGLAGLLVYFLTGQSRPAALAAVWLVLVAAVAGMVPLVGLAFRQFDVARDTPPG